MPRDSAAADRPASYLVGTAAAFLLFFRDRTKPINHLPFSPSAKFPKSGSSCESRVNPALIDHPQPELPDGVPRGDAGKARRQRTLQSLLRKRAEWHKGQSP